MNRIGTIVLTASALMAVTVATAGAQDKKVPGANRASATQAVTTGTAAGELHSTPLFRIGGLEVHLWTPVEPPYDPNANRNFAADPLWEAGIE